MRWNGTVVLHSEAEPYQDEEGAWHRGSSVHRTVFCNERKYASMFMGNLRSNDVRSLNNNLQVDMGQMPECQLDVRTDEYLGEQTCTYRGLEYKVLYVVRAGELSTLALVRRIGNV